MLNESRRRMSRISTLLVGAAVTFLAGSCSGIRGDLCQGGRALVSVSYIGKGPVGLVQKLTYYSDGRLRLDAANLKTYCSSVGSSERERLNQLLESDEIDQELDEFGKNLRYPKCFLQEDISLEISAKVATARIDALQGALLALVEELEVGANQAFGRAYMISIVQRSTQQDCPLDEHDAARQR